MANQFTKGTRTKHDESTKDKIRAEVLAQRLFKYAKAKGQRAEKLKMDNAQVAAAKVLIERGKPALQAVEQTILNPLDQLTEEEIGEQAKALIISQPQYVFAAIDSDPAFRAAVQAHLSQRPVLVEPVNAQNAA